MRDFGELLINAQQGNKEKVTNNYTEERPWGSFENLLDEKYCKVKRIIVKPEQRLSYQYHHKRAETWVVVQGTASVRLDDKDKDYFTGQIVSIPIGTKHRVQNKGKEDLIFIETQTGTYFGEDDIVRLEDDYKRIEKKEDKVEKEVERLEKKFPNKNKEKKVDDLVGGEM
tara:strand:- start:374 stop:883 length:510 start_codon:yes stop_codon:yes gene_type:complete